MKKYIFVIIAAFLLAISCCSSASPQNIQPITESALVVVSQGHITCDPIYFNSKQTTLYIKDLHNTFAEVQYRIWRFADGPNHARIFSSKDTENQFALPFSLQAFNWKRGEYKIETIGIKSDGEYLPLAHSSITFEQTVPFLMYHGIDEYRGIGIKNLFVPPSQFESHMRYLKDNGYTLLTFERWSDVNRVNKPIFVTFDDGMKDNLNAFYILKKLKDEHFKPAATAYIMSAAIGMTGYLSAADIKIMSDSGIFAIGSHTVSHDYLPRVPNIEQELTESANTISRITGKPVLSLAYPSGMYNNKVVEQAKKQYAFAVTANDGLFVQKHTPNENYLINRLYITPALSMERFIEKIQGYYN